MGSAHGQGPEFEAWAMGCHCATCRPGAIGLSCEDVEAEDFAEMESRPGGGGAGAVCWLLGVLGLLGAAGAIWAVLHFAQGSIR